MAPVLHLDALKKKPKAARVGWTAAEASQDGRVLAKVTFPVQLLRRFGQGLR
jgi:hypothetical protein